MGSFTVKEIQECAWAKKRMSEPYAVSMGRGDFGLTLEVLTLEQVLDLAESYELQPGPEDSNVPQHVAFWMDVLDLASVYSLEKATMRLSAHQRLDLLSRWFNGGGGLPWKKDKYDGPRPNLGHRSIMNQFIRWLIHYLALDDTVDGRISLDSERLINTARELSSKSPVTRWP